MVSQYSGRVTEFSASVSAEFDQVKKRTRMFLKRINYGITFHFRKLPANICEGPEGDMY